MQLSHNLQDSACQAFFHYAQGLTLRWTPDRIATRDAFGSASVLYARLVEADPHIFEPNLAATLNNLGTVLSDRRELAEAQQAYERALEIRERLAEADPHIFEPNLAATLNNLGNVLRDRRELAEAQQAYERAGKIYERLAEADPHIFEPNLAATLNNLGNVLSDRRELAEAQQAYERALEIRERLAEADPHIFEPNLAATLNNLGNVLRDRRELAEAQQAYERAGKIYERLAEANPHIFEPDVAMTLNNLGNVLSDRRELAEAQQAYERAGKIYERLAEADPHIFEPNLAATLNNLGNVLSDRRELAEAQQAYERALEIRARLVEADPHIFEPNLAATLNNLGTVLRDRRELAEAQQAYERAGKIYERLAEANPHIFEPNLAATLNNLGNVLSDRRELAEAQQAYERALEIRERLVEADPHIFEPNLAATLNNLGNVLRDRRELAEAQQAYERAGKIYERLAEANPHIFEPDVAMTLNNLGNVLRDRRELAEAQQAYERAGKIYERLAEADPHIFEPNLAATLNNLGNVLSDRRELAEAQQAYERAGKIYERLAEANPQEFLHEKATTLVGYACVARSLGENSQQQHLLAEACQTIKSSSIPLSSANIYDTAGSMIWLHNPSQAKRWFEIAFRGGQRDLAGISISEDSQLDLHKRVYETACRWKIHQISSHDSINHSFQLEILESLRRVEQRSQWRETDSLLDTPQTAVEDLPQVTLEQDEERIDHRLKTFAAERDRRLREGLDFLAQQDLVMLYIQPTPQGIVFSRFGIPKPQTVVGNRDFNLAMQSLLQLTQRVFREWDPDRKAHWHDESHLQPKYVGFDHLRVQKRIQELGKAAWSHLPAIVQQWFMQDGPRLYLSLHGEANNWPWELLAPESGFLGLSTPLPRIGTLSDLTAVVSRQPQVGKALLVGDSLGTDEKNPDLKGALDSVNEIQVMLQKYETSEILCLTQREATEEAIKTHLNDPNLGFFLFCGHGGPSPFGGALRLAKPRAQQELEERQNEEADVSLAGNILETLGARWDRHPFCHIDCCFGGWQSYHGGGRSWGWSQAALNAGASVVLSAWHTLGDRDAQLFTKTFYETWLGGNVPASDALLAARRAAFEIEQPQDVILWALPTLCGNAGVHSPY